MENDFVQFSNAVKMQIACHLLNACNNKQEMAHFPHFVWLKSLQIKEGKTMDFETIFQFCALKPNKKKLSQKVSKKLEIKRH